MERNVRLVKYIIILNNSLFWLGIWLFYYLLFTNYSGVGLIETTVLLSGFLLEIPTGAIADLLGKRKTIIIGLLLGVIGNFYMAFSFEFSHLLISVVFLGIGGALLSGSWEALLYDFLLQSKKEKMYDKILANIEKHKLLVMAMASVIGGFIYKVNPRGPFLLVGVAMLISFVLAFFLIEPEIDSIKFSFKNYFKQNFKGFSQLFSTSKSKLLITKLLILYSLSFILIEILDTALALDVGYDAVKLGLLYGVLPVISAVGVHYYGFMKKLLGISRLRALIFVTFLTSLVFSPFYGLFMVTFILVYRNIFYSVVSVIASDTVNRLFESKYRATTLSTFSMLKSLPYVLFALQIGNYMDKWTPSYTATLLAVVFIVLGVIVYGYELLKRD